MRKKKELQINGEGNAWSIHVVGITLKNISHIEFQYTKGRNGLIFMKFNISYSLGAKWALGVLFYARFSCSLLLYFLEYL